MSPTASSQRSRFIAALFGDRVGRVVDLAQPTSADDPPDSAIWDERAAGRFDMAAARRAHELLRANGKLAIRLTDGGDAAHPPVSDVRALSPRQGLVLTLSDVGFVILDEDVQGPASDADPEPRGAWVLARKAPFQIRGYQAGDEAAIGALFTTSFHVTRDKAAWRWKFLAHPAASDTPPIALAWSSAEDAKAPPRLVGQYAALPMRFAHAGGDVDAALQLCDIMTASEARRVGRGPTAVLSRMLRCLYARHAEHRIAFVIGWNTATSRAFALRFHAGREVEPVAYWTRDVAEPEAVAGYRIREIDRFDARFDRFFQRVLPAYDYLQQRDARYLTWRFGQPGVQYLRLAAWRWGRLVGWAIFRRTGNTLVWGDALIDPRHARVGDGLLRAALQHAQMTGVTQSTAWFSERPAWWRERLVALGFARREEPNDLSLIFGVHAAPDAGERLARLYYTQADSDLF